MIDILKYTRELEETGLTREQAEKFVRSQIQMITDNVVSSSEFISEINGIKANMDRMKSELQGQMNDLKSEIKQLDISTSLEIQKMVNRLGVIVVSSISALGVFQGVIFWIATK